MRISSHTQYYYFRMASAECADGSKKRYYLKPVSKILHAESLKNRGFAAAANSIGEYAIAQGVPENAVGIKMIYDKNPSKSADRNRVVHNFFFYESRDAVILSRKAARAEGIEYEIEPISIQGMPDAHRLRFNDGKQDIVARFNRRPLVGFIKKEKEGGRIIPFDRGVSSLLSLEIGARRSPRSLVLPATGTALTL